MLKCLGTWLLFPVRTRTRTMVSASVAVTVALVAVGAWYGLRAWRFHRDEAAAREALAAYDFPEARRKLASCLALERNNPEILLLAAQAARRDGFLDEAREYLDHYKSRMAPPIPEEAALQEILLQVQYGEVKKYVHKLIDFLEIRHPASEQILEALAQGCFNIYRLDNEESFWTKQLLSRFPNNPLGRLLEAQTKETLRQRKPALALARRLVEDYPNYDKARFLLAQLLIQAHQFQEAADHYRVLHHRQPSQAEPLIGLVRALLHLEELPEAEPLLHELEKFSDNSDAMLECGRFALRQGHPEEAEPFLSRAVQLAPHDHEAHYQLAVCLGQLNRPSEARKHRDQLKQLEEDMILLEKTFMALVEKPGDLQLRREAGKICLRHGQVSEGLRWLTGILDLAPDDKPTHQILGDYFASQGETQRAKYHHDKAR